MLSSDKSISKSQGQGFEILDADVYQVQIVDISEKEGTKFNSSEPVQQFEFKCEVVEEENLGKRVFIWTTQSWFDGGKSSKPSKLFDLVRQIYAFYHKDVNVKDMEEINFQQLNDLIGKQLRVTVTVTENGRNRVVGFMPIKKELPYDMAKNSNTNIDADL
jgi:hypothetical protein